MREAIQQWVSTHAPVLELDMQVFENPETLERLCTACGGHIRELMQMMQRGSQPDGSVADRRTKSPTGNYRTAIGVSTRRRGAGMGKAGTGCQVSRNRK